MQIMTMDVMIKTCIDMVLNKQIDLLSNITKETLIHRLSLYEDIDLFYKRMANKILKNENIKILINLPLINALNNDYKLSTYLYENYIEPYEKYGIELDFCQVFTEEQFHTSKSIIYANKSINCGDYFYIFDLSVDNYIRKDLENLKILFNTRSGRGNDFWGFLTINKKHLDNTYFYNFKDICEFSFYDSKVFPEHYFTNLKIQKNLLLKDLHKLLTNGEKNEKNKINKI